MRTRLEKQQIKFLFEQKVSAAIMLACLVLVGFLG